MKIKVISASPKVEVVGLGLIETNVWVEVSQEKADRFEALQGRPLGEAFEIKKSTKKEAE